MFRLEQNAYGLPVVGSSCIALVEVPAYIHLEGTAYNLVEGPACSLLVEETACILLVEGPACIPLVEKTACILLVENTACILLAADMAHIPHAEDTACMLPVVDSFACKLPVGNMAASLLSGHNFQASCLVVFPSLSLQTFSSAVEYKLLIFLTSFSFLFFFSYPTKNTKNTLKSNQFVKCGFSLGVLLSYVLYLTMSLNVKTNTLNKMHFCDFSLSLFFFSWQQSNRSRAISS